MAPLYRILRRISARLAGYFWPKVRPKVENYPAIRAL
jgi:hypothetical protein